MIKLTKKMPTEEGWYFYTRRPDILPMPEHLYAANGRLFLAGGQRLMPSVGGYWAKVEQSHFEVCDK